WPRSSGVATSLARRVAILLPLNERSATAQFFSQRDRRAARAAWRDVSVGAASGSQRAAGWNSGGHRADRRQADASPPQHRISTAQGPLVLDSLLSLPPLLAFLENLLPEKAALIRGGDTAQGDSGLARTCPKSVEHNQAHE